MKKVCFLIGNLNLTGGTERVTSLIANELVKQNYDILILSLFMGMQPAFEIDNDVKLYSLFPEQVSMKRNFFSAIWKIRNFVKSQKIETLIVVDSISCIFTVPALLGLKINHICWEHFSFIDNNGSKMRGFSRKLASIYCSKVVTLTNHDMYEWKKRLFHVRTKITCIPNPTPFSHINNFPQQNNKIVLAVGRLSFVKGFDLLIDAWSKVCKIDQDWVLEIVGSGDQEIILKKQVELLNLSNRVRFVPLTKNISIYYEKASIYCLSSRFESFGMVLVEAQSYGLPIVAFDCNYGPSEIVQHKKNGLLVENGNVEKMSEKLLKIMYLNNDAFNSLVVKSRESSNRFKIQEISNHWKNII